VGLNDTPKAERVHISIFGKRNAGKSSLINSITGQDLAIVSDVRGTTTDPVYKAMELLPLGPVMIIDTPGLDDEGELGERRVKKALMVLNKSDIAIVVMDASEVVNDTVKKETYEDNIVELIRKKEIPFIVAINKTDLVEDWNEKENIILEKVKERFSCESCVGVSAIRRKNIHELKEILGKQIPNDDSELRIVADLIEPNDFVVLVVPIDSAAPKGRLILPQQQTIRDVLEAGAVSIVCKETELKETLDNLGKKPKLVITDSQAFEHVDKDTPENILLTSFSILFSRYKGDLKTQVMAARAVEGLKDGDRILMSEGCTHHRQCGDIGTVKIPNWLLKHTKKKLIFETSSGTEFPEDLSKYAMVVHCGGCMLNRREMQFRIKQAVDQEIPIVNYGVLIAYMKGILKRSLTPFPEILKILMEE